MERYKIEDKEQLDKWTDGNFEKLRYEYDLSKDSVCFDLGAFHCDWSIKISDIYSNPVIYAFEPSLSFFNIANDKIGERKNIKLFNYGLGKDNYNTQINIGPGQGVSTSLFVETEIKENIIIKSIKDIFDELNIDTIHLMKINIEGSEYDVIECMLDNNIHTKVKNIQVQFHRLTDNYLDRYEKIKEKLSLTHELTYSFPFIWENWRCNE